MTKQEIMDAIEEIKDELERIKDSLSDADNRWGIEGACDDMSILMDKLDGLHFQLNANTKDF